MDEKFSIVGDFKDFFNNNLHEETFDENIFLSFLKENFISEPKKDNISFIVDAFKEFYDKNIRDQEFDVKAFMDFMEPKFTQASYREKFNLNPVEPKKQNNILILTDLGVGDFIVSTGAIREVCRIYPEAHITLVCYTQPSIFAKLCPYVDEVILYDTFKGGVPSQGILTNICNDELLKFYKWNMDIALKLLARRFDVGFIFATHGNMELLMYMSGAKVRLTSMHWKTFNNPERIKKNQTYRYFKLFATHQALFSDSRCNMVDRHFSLIENLLHVPISNRKLEAWYTEEDLSVAKSYLKNITGSIYSLNMGGIYEKKHYPPEKYARLLELIVAEEPNAHFVILGGGNEDLQSAEIIKKTSPELYAKRIIDLTNKLTYRQSAAALSFCKMLIGNDTGTVHVAAAVGCLVLSPHCFAADLKMKNTDAPGRWAPYGVPNVIVQPQHALPECKPKKSSWGCKMEIPHCITQIEPETLLRGFHLLKERAEKKITETLYIH